MTGRVARAYLHVGAVVASAVLISPAASAQNIYKSVDEKGEVEFSDRPTEGAQRVETVKQAPPSDTEAADTRTEIERVKRAGEEMERDRKARAAKSDAESRARAAAPKPSPPSGGARNPHHIDQTEPHTRSLAAFA